MYVGNCAGAPPVYKQRFVLLKAIPPRIRFLMAISPMMIFNFNKSFANFPLNDFGRYRNKLKETIFATLFRTVIVVVCLFVFANKIMIDRGGGGGTELDVGN